jgi:IS30 family transposase
MNTRRSFSSDERTELWSRWRAGESMSSIGRCLDRSPDVVYFTLKCHGGITPRPCRRSPRALTLAEREEISRGIAAGLSIRQMALGLGRAPSTVSREIARHGGAPDYRAADADLRALRSARRPKACRLATNPRLRALVESKLSGRWSPEQIAGWLKYTFPNTPDMQVSTETIYRSLFIQSRGVLKQELVRQLRTRRAMRRAKRQQAFNVGGQAKIVEAISIRQRPAEAEDRAVPGHWEGDLLVGSGQSAIATLAERHSRFVMLVRVTRKDSATVVKALTRQVRKLPKQLRRSLTWDRGYEMARHKEFTLATDLKVYFCDPQSPWQRGTNENTNGLLRQYFPKRTDLSGYTQAQLDKVALEMNQRPRKTLGFRTPADCLGVAMTD